MNNLLQYILSFMFIDYGLDVPGVIAGGCVGNGVSYRVTEASEGWVTITVTNGKIKISTNEPEDCDWGMVISKMTSQIHSFDNVDIGKAVKKLHERYLKKGKEFLKDIGGKEWTV